MFEYNAEVISMGTFFFIFKRKITQYFAKNCVVNIKFTEL